MSSLIQSVLVTRNYDLERDQIFRDLQLIVRESKGRYAGKTEIATLEGNSRIAKLCELWEIVLWHGLKSGSMFKGNSASFWEFAQRQLTKHEKERFSALKNVWTDRGKSRALIRAALNERSLERYTQMWVCDEKERFYDDWACMRDSRAIKLLPEFARDLSGILFALTVDDGALNAEPKSTRTEKIEPVIATGKVIQPKKINARTRDIVSFDETPASVEARSLASICLKYEEPQFEESEVATKEEVASTQAESSRPTERRKSSSSSQRHHPSALSELEQEIQRTSTSIIISSPSDEGLADSSEESIISSQGSSVQSSHSSNSSSNKPIENVAILRAKLKEKEERCAELEAQLAKLSLENHRLRMLSTGAPRNQTVFFSVTIPRAFLEAIFPSGKKYFVYEIHVTPSNCDGWIVKRRYSEFYALHKRLREDNPSVKTLDFPPKKKFGNMDAGFVEQRRQRLQVYLKHLLSLLPDVAVCTTRSELVREFAFLDPEKKKI